MRDRPHAGTHKHHPLLRGLAQQVQKRLGCTQCADEIDVQNLPVYVPARGINHRHDPSVVDQDIELSVLRRDLGGGLVDGRIVCDVELDPEAVPLVPGRSRRALAAEAPLAGSREPRMVW